MNANLPLPLFIFSFVFPLMVGAGEELRFDLNSTTADADIIFTHPVDDASLLGTADIDGDGFQEFFLRDRASIVYVLDGRTIRRGINSTTESVALIYSDNRDQFGFGFPFWTGHFNSDSNLDFCMCKRNQTLFTGTLYLRLGNGALPQGNIDINLLATNTFEGTNYRRGFCQGSSGVLLGDINGDGIQDFGRGSDYERDISGRYYLFLGRRDWSAENWNNTIRLQGEQRHDSLGWDDAAIGDVNDDGSDDVLIGAWGHDTNRGAGYVILGSSDFQDGNYAISQFAVSRFAGVNEQEAASYGGMLGDINGDSFSDFAIGTSANAAVPQFHRAYVLFGRRDGGGGTIHLPMPLLYMGKRSVTDLVLILLH